MCRCVQVYRYGANYAFYGLTYTLTMVVTSEVFLPVFYRLAISSTYEVRETTDLLLLLLLLTIS